MQIKLVVVVVAYNYDWLLLKLTDEKKLTCSGLVIPYQGHPLIMCASTCGVPPFLCLKTRVLSCHYNSLIISFDFGLCYKEGEGSSTDIIGQPLTDQHDTFRITLSDVTTNFPHR